MIYNRAHSVLFFDVSIPNEKKSVWVTVVAANERVAVTSFQLAVDIFFRAFEDNVHVPIKTGQLAYHRDQWTTSLSALLLTSLWCAER